MEVMTRRRLGGAYMATLCEMMVFSFNSNSWNWSGLRTFFGSAMITGC